MRADRGVRGENADIRLRTGVWQTFQADTNKPSFLSQDSDVCPFPGLDPVRPAENFPSNQLQAHQVKHTQIHAHMDNIQLSVQYACKNTQSAHMSAHRR